MLKTKAFSEFANLFLIPQKILSSALSTGGGNVAQQLNDAFVKPYSLIFEIAPKTIDYYIDRAYLREKVGIAFRRS